MAAEATGGLSDLWDALRRRRWTAVLVALPLLAGVLLYVQTLPDEYDGRALVAFAPELDEPVGADVIRLTVPKYVAYLTSPATAAEVGEEIGESPVVLEEAVEATTSPDTPTLTVVVRLGDPERAARAANAFAEEAVRFAGADDDQLRAQVLAPALVPREPASPPRRLLMAGGLVLALLTGATMAVVVDRSRPKVVDPLGLALATGHGVVGRLPRARVVRRRGIAEALNDPAVGTAVRAMRTQLELQSRTAPVRTLGVTSPLSGDGKTTVAALLAAALARVDATVLLVDADMRRPRVAGTFGLADDVPGLDAVLAGEATLEQAARPSGLPGLSVVTTRPRDDAGDLIARRMHGVLEQARSSYDVVVVDGPPVLATDDARTLALVVDGMLLVVGGGQEVGRAAEAAAALDALKVRVLGSVLNRARGGSRGSMGSYGSYAAVRGA